MVLIADDNPGVRRVLTQCLGVGDRVLLTAENGEEALTLARAHLPDLIILDVRMPGRDGHQICSDLREDVNTAHIPVLMITGQGALEAELGRIGSRADSHLAKPFNINELEARVRTLLGGRRRDRSNGPA